MSDLGNLFNPPYIEDVEGFVTASTITDLVNEIDTTVDLLESAIGNIYGLSSVTDNEEKFTNNIASSLGGMAHEYVVPSGVEFAGYSQSFALNDNKTFVLDLIPSSSVLIDDGIHPTSFWTEQLSTKDLAVSTDYCIIGTLITFYAPASNFTITYTGTYPQFGEDGYLPNIIPNRRLRNISAIAQPTVTNVSGIRYNIIIDTSDGNGYIGLADTINYELAPHLAMYVDPLGATECPSQYISVWSKSGAKFNKIDTTAIFIKSETEYEFTTNETVSLLDEHAIILSNRGIADDLYATINLLLNHSHNSEDGTNTIAHASLNDLIPVSDNADIKYAGSILKQNHHPQYMHREGYKNDPGTYNNAMLGDLLLASINPSSLFNNLLNDSNKIFFSSTSAGHSLYRRAINGDLHLASSANGLSISYDNTDIDNYGLNIAGHKISRVNTDLMINAVSGLTIFQNELQQLQNISVNQVLSNTVIANDLVHIANNGAIEIGNISITHDGSDITISGTNNSTDKLIIETICDIGTANIVNLNISTMNLEGDDKIKFLPSIGAIDTFLAPLASGGAKFNSAKPLAFTGVGKNTGLSLTNGAATEVYANIYTSSENGLIPTSSDHNTYFETGTHDVYFLQDTTDDKTVDGELYSWNNPGAAGTNVTNLKNWPKSNVYANTLNGNKFKLSQYNAISYTGTLQGLNSNKTIINADNGVLFTRDQSNVYGVGSLNKCDIEVKDVYANNVITNIITAETSSIKHISIPSDGTNAVLTVYGQSAFNAPVTISSTLDVNSTLTSSSIENVGNIRTNSIQVAGNISTDTLSVLKSVAFAGISSVDAEFSSLKISDKIEFTQTGKEIRMNNGAIIGLQMPSISSPTDAANKGYIDALVSSASGTASGGLAQEIQNRIAADNTKANLAGSTTQLFSVATATANGHAVRKEQLDAVSSVANTVTSKAAKNGDSAEVFSAANGTTGNQVVNFSQLSAVSVSAGATLKAEYAEATGVALNITPVDIIMATIACSAGVATKFRVTAKIPFSVNGHNDPYAVFVLTNVTGGVDIDSSQHWDRDMANAGMNGISVLQRELTITPPGTTAQFKVKGSTGPNAGTAGPTFSGVPSYCTLLIEIIKT